MSRRIAVSLFLVFFLGTSVAWARTANIDFDDGTPGPAEVSDPLAVGGTVTFASGEAVMAHPSQPDYTGAIQYGPFTGDFEAETTFTTIGDFAGSADTDYATLVVTPPGYDYVALFGVLNQGGTLKTTAFGWEYADVQTGETFTATTRATIKVVKTDGNIDLYAAYDANASMPLTPGTFHYVASLPIGTADPSVYIFGQGFDFTVDDFVISGDDISAYPDTDGDGLSDYDEVNTYGTDPNDPDSDDDDLLDGWEVQFGLDPNEADTDEDTIADGDEDEDEDGLSNVEEQDAETDPADADTDGDLLNDGDEVNVHGTDPNDPDTDSDDLSDYEEVITYGTDPKSRDTDGDGLSDGEEVNTHATNPLDDDTDDDGFTDLVEIINGSDPNDPDSTPTTPDVLVQHWRNLGLYGGAGRMLAVDPNDSSHIFLSSGRLGEGLYSYATTDAGLNWIRLPINGNTMFYDPNDSSTLYHGQYRSTDNGLNWQLLPSLPELTWVVAVKPGDSSTLYAVTSSGLHEIAHVYKSIDAGENWADITPAGIVAARCSVDFGGRPIAFDPHEPDTIYIGFDKNPIYEETDYGVYKSIDGGSNWVRNLSEQIHTVLAHPLDPDLLLAVETSVGGGNNLWRSDDGGESWAVVLDSAGAAVAFVPTDPNTVYSFQDPRGHMGFAKSDDFGLTWTDFSVPDAVGVMMWPVDVVIPAANPSVAYLASAQDGFSRISLGHGSFEERNRGIEEINVQFGFVSDDGNHIVIGCEKGASVSFDGSETWNHCSRHFVGAMCVDSETDQTIYWSVGTEILVSFDGGVTWVERGWILDDYAVQPGVSCMLESPDYPDTLFMGVFDTQVVREPGLYVSNDGGDTLVQTPLFVGDDWIRQLAAESDVSYLARVPEPTSPSRLLYAAVGRTDLVSGISGLYWSEDSGNLWSLRGLADMHVRAIALDSSDGRIVYATYVDSTHQSRLARSEDAGLTWTQIYGGGHHVVSLSTSRHQPGRVYAGVLLDDTTSGEYSRDGAIWQSDDYGEHWSVLIEGIERLQLVVAGSLYGGMNGGFYEYDPPWQDTDGDGLRDDDETRDLDPDEEDVQNPFNPSDPDSTGNSFSEGPDGIPDGLNDWDGDGMTNADEFMWDYDPTDPESWGEVPAIASIGLFLLVVFLVAATRRRIRYRRT